MARLAVITGANTGLGYETAKALLKDGCEVLMANRSEERSRRAMAKLERLGLPGSVRFALLDLEDRESIRRFAEGFLERNGRIDLLINNAGVLLPEQSRSVNGLERHFDVNYLGHFYLNQLLLPALAEDATVISLSSLAHKMDIADIHFGDLSFEEEEYGKMKAYAQSKLAMALFGVELSRRFQGSARRSLIVHPGVCNTNIVSRYFPGGLVRLLTPVIRLAGVTGPGEGARPIIRAALDESLHNGAYVGPTGRKEWSGSPGLCSLSDKALDQERAARLWKISEDLLGIPLE